ncbi:membrane hypothetical protein [Nostocoides japonicum T1-X7]|uniref:DUF1648 domain-containing protein n=1 Tax=Nostocoides japonicum T1-X7 TaxID=1194083 RepID=A0A077M413_9MICO|nr:DUF1648 domain-containing protein [Tetrasphaera japonica]CCH78890.1 membrane hypothetical protein [Tetrasphaera japonica T1-X7]
MWRWGRQLLWVGVVAFLVSLVWAWFALPAEDIPTHWSGSGPADDYQSRALFLPLLGLFGAAVTAVLLGVARLIGRSRRLVGLNVPNREEWARAENHAEAVRRLWSSMSGLAGLMLLLFAAIPLMSWLAVRSPDHELPGAATTLIVVFVAALTGWIVVVLRAFASPGSRP